MSAWDDEDGIPMIDVKMAQSNAASSAARIDPGVKESARTTRVATVVATAVPMTKGPVA
jgi:hypothetical protein